MAITKDDKFIGYASEKVEPGMIVTMPDWDLQKLEEIKLELASAHIRNYPMLVTAINPCEFCDKMEHLPEAIRDKISALMRLCE